MKHKAWSSFSILYRIGLGVTPLGVVGALCITQLSVSSIGSASVWPWAFPLGLVAGATFSILYRIGLGVTSTVTLSTFSIALSFSILYRIGLGVTSGYVWGVVLSE